LQSSEFVLCAVTSKDEAAQRVLWMWSHLQTWFAAMTRVRTWRVRMTMMAATAQRDHRKLPFTTAGGPHECQPRAATPSTGYPKMMSFLRRRQVRWTEVADVLVVTLGFPEDASETSSETWSSM